MKQNESRRAAECVNILPAHFFNSFPQLAWRFQAHIDSAHTLADISRWWNVCHADPQWIRSTNFGVQKCKFRMLSGIFLKVSVSLRGTRRCGVACDHFGNQLCLYLFRITGGGVVCVCSSPVSVYSWQDHKNGTDGSRLRGIRGVANTEAVLCHSDQPIPS